MNSNELIIINNEVALQIEEKVKLVAETEAIKLKLAFQYCEKDEREAELTVANIELAFQNGEKEKWAAELTIANIELAQICAVQRDEKWEFSVSDNGIGIDSSHFERVFDLFNVCTPMKKYAGNGIGRANCKRIVQSHQGEIWIESIGGQGTTFKFKIPS